MMFVRARIRDAEKVRRELIKLGILSSRHRIKKAGGFVYFPITRVVPDREFDYVDMEPEPRMKKPSNLREALVGILSEEEMENLITSFDVIGDIAIIQIPDELQQKAINIARAVMQVHGNIKVVCQKLGSRAGKFRTLPLKVVLGEQRFETVHREHGVLMRVDVRRTYFSPRLSTERGRIADQVNDGETIAVLFAGVGPFALVIAKKRDVRIYAVELNPFAYELLVKNINLNKLKGEIIPILGDVRNVYKDLPPCDRVLMPAPKDAGDFLHEGISILKPGGLLHFYAFSDEEDLYGPPITLLKDVARKMGRSAEVVGKRVVRPYKPRVYQVAIDAIIR